MSAALRLWAVGANTLREAVRNRLLYALLFFAIVIIAAGVLISTLSYVERERILQDVGFAAIRVFGAGIAIFVGVGLIHREVERRTIYTILSKPISRSAFLFGKYLGLVVTMWLMLAVMGAAFGAISLVMGAPFDAAHLAALALIGVELALIVAVTTLFSSFTTPFLASLFSVGIWVLGHGTRELRQLGRAGDLEGLGGLTAFVYRVLPDLEAFNLTLEAVHGLAAFVFERRDFR